MFVLRPVRIYIYVYIYTHISVRCRVQAIVLPNIGTNDRGMIYARGDPLQLFPIVELGVGRIRAALFNFVSGFYFIFY